MSDKTATFTDLESTPWDGGATAAKWGRAKRLKRLKRLESQLARELPALARYEAKMRRAFSHWDKTRARLVRMEREIDTLSGLEFAEAAAPEAQP